MQGWRGRAAGERVGMLRETSCTLAGPAGHDHAPRQLDFLLLRPHGALPSAAVSSRNGGRQPCEPCQTVPALVPSLTRLGATGATLACPGSWRLPFRAPEATPNPALLAASRSPDPSSRMARHCNLSCASTDMSRSFSKSFPLPALDHRLLSRTRAMPA